VPRTQTAQCNRSFRPPTYSPQLERTCEGDILEVAARAHCSTGLLEASIVEEGNQRLVSSVFAQLHGRDAQIGSVCDQMLVESLADRREQRGRHDHEQPRACRVWGRELNRAIGNHPLVLEGDRVTAEPDSPVEELPIAQPLAAHGPIERDGRVRGRRFAAASRSSSPAAARLPSEVSTHILWEPEGGSERSDAVAETSR
jgi:hypothetical protein